MEGWVWVLVAAGLSVGLSIIVSHARRVEVGDTVLLVTAHPDDEAMFFAPTMISLAQRKCKVHILCLSTGNFDGLGKVRTKELAAAAAHYGIPHTNVQIVDDPKLQDGMDNKWEHTAVAEYVDRAVKTYKPTDIFTFDEWGVSRHPNHCHVHEGVKVWKASGDSDNNVADDIKVWYLESTSIFRKYIGVLDLVISQISGRPHLTALAPLTVYAGMAAHASQFVWYRRLFVLFSRYSIVNTY